MKGRLEIVSLKAEHQAPLVRLFERISGQDSKSFHPHPFDQETAGTIARHSGRDQYDGGMFGAQLIGYGLLRGWDAGYAVPSLGIYIVPEARGKGLSNLLMHHLHLAAKLSGASRVRLKVNRDNVTAKRLYERFGYRFEEFDEQQLLGILELG
jgi:ribosomal protein S18 acetylase RimI-like enzyme